MGKTKGLTSALHTLQPRQVLEAEAGDLADGGGLVLRVSATGASWVLRYTGPTGKRREMGLGPAHRASLRQAGENLVAAREQAKAARDLLRQGEDPLEVRQRQREAAQARQQTEQQRQAEAQAAARWTLARCARAYHERVIEPSRTPRHAAQWISSLENHIPAAVWHAPIAEVTAPQLLQVLCEVRPHKRARRHTGNTVPETLRRIRQRLEAVFDDAEFHGRCSGNPAAAVRRKMAEAAPKRQVKGKFKALAYREAPALMQRLQAVPGTAARCLELAILTAARTSEVMLAEWSEFDLDAGTWTVPADRMKMREVHVVHLSTQALQVLRAQAGQDDRWVFPSPQRAVDGTGRPLSNMAMLATLGRLGVRDQTTVHGLCRATFSTWANETAAGRGDAIEACLAHKEGDRIRAAYNRATFAAERRALLQAWADFLAQPAAPVVALPARAA